MDSICSIHSYYDNEDLTKIDFCNFSPQKKYIYQANGYIKTIEHEQYVITCNHIIKKYSTKNIGYCYYKKQLVELILEEKRRIPEIDIIIMKIIEVNVKSKDIPVSDELTKSVELSDLSDLDISTDLSSVIQYRYTDNAILSRQLEHPFLSTLTNIKDDMTFIFDTLKYKIVRDIPLLCIDNNSNKDFFSGNIIQSDGKNIGIVSMNKENKIIIIPFFLIDILINNIFMGIQLDTIPCDISHLEKDMFAHIVDINSCPYPNGKKTFIFHKDDVIMKVDDKQFNKDKMIFCELMNMFIPLNTYMMIQSILKKTIAVSVYRNDKIKTYNLSGIDYNDMYPVKLYSNIVFVKKNFYTEMNEDILIYHFKNGNIVKINVCEKYITMGERIIVSLNKYSFKIIKKVKNIQELLS